MVDEGVTHKVCKAIFRRSNPFTQQGVPKGERLGYQNLKEEVFEHVSMDFLFVWKQQHDLFKILDAVLKKRMPTEIGKKVEWIKPNASNKIFLISVDSGLNW